MISETWYRITIVSCLAVLSTTEGYDNKLTKLWSLSGASKSDGSAIVNVTSASIVIQPSGQISSRRTKDFKGTPSDYSYAFRPRTIPVRYHHDEKVYHSQDVKYKSEVPFPGNYHIAKEKGSESLQESPHNYVKEGAFHPRAIPLIINPEFQGRSLSEDEEPILEKPEGFSEVPASKRSLSFLGAEDDEEEVDEEEEEEEEDGEYEISEDTDDKGHKHKPYNKIKKKLNKKSKKMTKYMMPLLLAYKLKYFALVPVMIGGLVLLVGATGLAGFFFALFAAVMGLQKGGY
ncbi:uncharacterized protein LOC106708317 [Papilio machaon]|uniref:uncharacterized protein LOC106708317 n=1 Tax=Papilio machaon TaxID=76193 RepID=UPI001E664DA4|nr:uncharacterized protein LOC106708317 [Papilio machaon]